METVEVIISGGAVQSVTVPEGTKLVIKDYDVEKDDWDRNNVLKDENGDCYQLMEFDKDW